MTEPKKTEATELDDQALGGVQGGFIAYGEEASTVVKPGDGFIAFGEETSTVVKVGSKKADGRGFIAYGTETST